jgi:hypothetical protein
MKGTGVKVDKKNKEDEEREIHLTHKNRNRIYVLFVFASVPVVDLLIPDFLQPMTCQLSDPTQG